MISLSILGGVGGRPALKAADFHRESIRGYLPGVPWDSTLGGRPGRAPWEGTLGGHPGRGPWEGALGWHPGRAPWESTLGGDPGRGPWEGTLGGHPENYENHRIMRMKKIIKSQYFMGAGIPWVPPLRGIPGYPP